MLIGKFLRTFLSAKDVKQPQVLTVTSVEAETVGQGDQAETKPVVYFKEVEQGLVLNKTNGEELEGLMGPDTDSWIGKKIELYHDENVYFQGKKVGGLKVRLPAAKK
jgi:hypothetical protein